jgi:hypothetical protein
VQIPRRIVHAYIPHSSSSWGTPSLALFMQEGTLAELIRVRVRV